MSYEYQIRISKNGFTELESSRMFFASFRNKKDAISVENNKIVFRSCSKNDEVMPDVSLLLLNNLLWILINIKSTYIFDEIKKHAAGYDIVLFEEDDDEPFTLEHVFGV